MLGNTSSIVAAAAAIHDKLSGGCLWGRVQDLADVAGMPTSQGVALRVILIISQSPPLLDSWEWSRSELWPRRTVSR